MKRGICCQKLRDLTKDKENTPIGKVEVQMHRCVKRSYKLLKKVYGFFIGK
jgi:hypothetical protein